MSRRYKLHTEDKMNLKKQFLLISLISLGWTGCSTDDETDAGMGTEVETTSPLSVSLSGLESLGADFEYEGWLSDGTDVVSTGTFDLLEGETSYTGTFDIDNDVLDSAVAFILSIEPAVDPDPAPAATKILGGAITNGAANLTLGHGAALGSLLNDAAGSYIIATPSTDDESDDSNGIWFLEMTEDGMMPSLSLPELNSGWVYEGWVVDENGPHTTGRFTSAEGADDDATNMYMQGPNATPPFPGHDFIDPALLVAGQTIVISVEPEPDNSPAPFALKPLVDSENAFMFTNQSATNNPTGSVSF